MVYVLTIWKMTDLGRMGLLLESWQRRRAMRRRAHGARHRHRCGRADRAYAVFSHRIATARGLLQVYVHHIRIRCGISWQTIDYLRRFPSRSRRPSISKLKVKRRVWSRGELWAVAIIYDASRRTTLSEKPAPIPKYERPPLLAFS
jgi:hypothetical protein